MPAELVNPEGCVLDGLVQLDVPPDLLLQRLEGRLPIDKWNRVETLVPPRAVQVGLPLSLRRRQALVEWNA